MVKVMRARTLILFSRVLTITLCAVLVFFVFPLPKVAMALIQINFGQPTPNLNLALDINGTPVSASSTVNLPIGKNLPVSVSVSMKSGDNSILDGSPNSYTYWDSFYLDFYKGTAFSGATFISGEQMNATSSMLKSTSIVTFPGPGTYSAVLYDSGNIRDYFAMCPTAWSCSPQTPLSQIRALIETWPDLGAEQLNPLGVVTFTILPSDPCAAPGSCISNVLFLPGIEGSRLYYRGALGIEHQVWEPDFNTDIPYLAMNADGTSKYQLYTKNQDIIGSLYGNNIIESQIAKLKLGGEGVQVYGDFKNSMNTLVASSTFGLKEWKSYPYDWRYDVRDIVNNGTPTEMPDGSIHQVYVKTLLEEMASSSPTGKVTIVAHSNGGLLAKALAESLGTDASKYIDRIIMVGTPQWGTPSSIGVMVHGDDQTQGLGLVMQGSEVRMVTETMPGAYGLLPSPAYFSHVGDPVVTFNASGLLSGKFAINFGSALSSFTTLKNFITDTAGLDSQMGDVTDLRVPLALSGTLVDKAVAMHATLDTWTPPTGVTVTAIAGWGQDTVKTLSYTTGSKVVCTNLLFASACADAPELEHTPVLTQDGDNTVVSSSAVGDTNGGLYFDSLLFEKSGNGKVVHQNLTSATPIQTVITELLKSSIPTANDFIKTTVPTGGTNPIKLRISSHSPVNLVVTDASGNQSGVLPIPGTDFSGVKRGILGSSVQVFDDEQYVNVPQSGTYQIIASGYAAGSATLNVDTVGSDGVVTATTTFADIPTTASSTITFSVTSGAPTAPLVDLKGDGTTTFTLSTSTDPLAYVQYMKAAIRAMTLSKSAHSVLDARLALIEKQLISEKKLKQKLDTLKKYPWNQFQNFYNPYHNLIKFELDMLEQYVKQQFTLSTLKLPHWQTTPLGMPASEAETILGMINQLKQRL